MKIWITANYDFLSLTHSTEGDNVPFQFDAPFTGNYIYRIRFRETIVKPLNCKTSDTEYVSDQQCLVNTFSAEHFSPWPIKCVPIQMKGLQYLNKSISQHSQGKIIVIVFLYQFLLVLLYQFLPQFKTRHRKQSKNVDICWQAREIFFEIFLHKEKVS